ncbi:hypothetical protein [Shouchella clausii]|uniref:hypothetical protein n=1 Tax=Shouchella clausii TaxID=79880 RepID=UPI001C7311E1|nr:hypothetical protein [Shouchella clausii]MBX0320261.1 hypothetical protein [Shouchella clausii]MEB5480722.1 hypothetical protein [Shouchella clausii]
MGHKICDGFYQVFSFSSEVLDKKGEVETKQQAELIFDERKYFWLTILEVQAMGGRCATYSFNIDELEKVHQEIGSVIEKYKNSERY